MFKPKQQLLQKLRWKQQQQQQQHLSLTAVKKARLTSSVTDAAAVCRPAGSAICCSEWIGDKIAVKADAWNDNSGIGWHLQQVCIQMSTHGGRAVCHTTTRTSFAIPRQKLCSLIAPGLDRPPAWQGCFDDCILNTIIRSNRCLDNITQSVWTYGVFPPKHVLWLGREKAIFFLSILKALLLVGIHFASPWDDPSRLTGRKTVPKGQKPLER